MKSLTGLSGVSGTVKESFNRRDQIIVPTSGAFEIQSGILFLGSSDILRVRTSDFSLLTTTPLGGDGIIGKPAFDVLNDFAYFPTGNPGTNGVKKLNMTTLVLTSLTLGVGFSRQNPIGGIIVGGFLYYASTLLSTTTIIKIDKSIFSEVDSIASAGGGGAIDSSFSDGTFLYFITSGFNIADPSRVIKIQISTFTIIDTLILPSSDDFVNAAVSDGTYLYLGTYSSPARIIRVRLSDFIRFDDLTLPVAPISENYINTMTINLHGTIFVFTDDFPSVRLVRIRTSDFTRRDSFGFNPDEFGLYGKIDISTNKLYINFGSFPPLTLYLGRWFERPP